MFLFFSKKKNPTVRLLTGFVASRDLWLAGVKGASSLSRSLSSLPVAFHCHRKNALNSQEWFCQDSQKETQIAPEHITHIARSRADPGTWVFPDRGSFVLWSPPDWKICMGFRSSATVQEGFERVRSIKCRSPAVTFTCSPPPLHSYQAQGPKKSNKKSPSRNSAQELMNTWRQ